MDLAILGLTVSSVNAIGAILRAVSFSLNRGKVAKRADQALARAREGNDRYDRIMSALPTIARRSQPTLPSSRLWRRQISAALASAENRLAAAIEQMNTRFGELNQRIDAFSTGESSRVLRISR